MSDLVTIETYSDSTEATLAKNDLIASGIKAVLIGEETNALWHVSSEMGTIKLQVASEDAVRAAEILKTPAEFLATDEELADDTGDMSEKYDEEDDDED